MKVIIVGGVAGGASAAARLRRLNEKAEIIILEKGEYISYANCGLPYYIGGKIIGKESLLLQTPQSFFDRFNIDVRVNNEVLKINPEKRTVLIKRLTDESIYEENYDKLILSPGAEPIKPELPGIEDPRIFTLRNIPDTFKIREFIDLNRPKNVLVVGGGYIGVEMAENLKRMELDVTIAELSDHLITPLDFEMSCFVHQYIRSKGIRLLLNSGVKSFNSSTSGLTALIGTKTLNFDFVILSVGVRPDSKLAKEAGLSVNAKGSIMVECHMMTSDKNIFAVGDAIEITNFVTGKPGFIPLAGPANKQGRIAADCICGIESTYEGTQGSAVLKIFDMTVATTGVNESMALSSGIEYDKNYTFSSSHASYYPSSTGMTIKLLFKKKSGENTWRRNCWF